MSISEQLNRPVTVLTSRPVPEPNPFTAVVRLPRDDGDPTVRHPTAHGSLHWAPHFDQGYGDRMDAIMRWVRDAQPEVFVVDVSVEVAVFVRLLGIPVVVTALPGNRIDAPHRLVHRMADQIIAAWPKDLRVPSWLRPYENKTAFVGGISRFDGRPRAFAEESGTRVVVLSGAEGMRIREGEMCPGADASSITWSSLGGTAGDWTADPWPQLSAADLVVTHAGQNSIADVAAASRPTIVIPQTRPFDEQRATAEVLHRHQLAVVVPRWPGPRAWPALMERAKSLDTARWKLWEVEGAARRAAAAIEDTAHRCRGRSAT
ncbi:glycosyltransferase [Mycobacterium sp. AMU20-3851]|uniref:glycosyltransferase n=1 Tax=Mycobacterium sp. AMU20-3851 TaxID=3122055 RepID=UPI003754D1F2